MPNFAEIKDIKFREVTNRGIYVRAVKPMKTHNATISSIKEIFTIGAKFEFYTDNSIRHEHTNGEPKLLKVVKTNTRSCWLAPVGTKSQILSLGTRHRWEMILEAYNNGNYQLYNL